MFRRFAVLSAGLLAVGMLSFVASIPAAHAKTAYTCASGDFQFQNIYDPSLVILDNGHNQEIQTNPTGSVFCLVDSGTKNWYEFVDVEGGLCIEDVSSMYYAESCNDSTYEQFNQSIPGPHIWENRHSGLYMSSLCTQASSINDWGSTNCGLNPSFNQEWATPSA